MSEWQPIETAPRDGTYILAWVRPVWGVQYLRIVTFYHGQWVDSCDLSPEDCTHWMPLPEPPKESRSELG